MKRIKIIGKKKGNEKFVPLHQQMTRVLLFPFLMSVLLCLGIIILSLLFLGRVNQIFDQHDAYTNYYKSVPMIDETLLDFLAEPGIETQKACDEANERLLSWAQKLVEASENHIMMNYYYMAETYTDCVKKVTSVLSGYTAKESAELYTETSIWKDTLIANKDALENIMEKERAYARENVTNYIKLQGFLVAGIFLTLFILCFFRSRKFMVRLAAPLRGLAAYAESIHDLNALPDIDISVFHNDEIKILADAFCRMIGIIRRQFQDLKEKGELEKRLRMAQLEKIKSKAQIQKLHLQMLQSRLNPHFLYNSLNIGISLAYEENAERTVNALNVFASYLRYSLSNQDKTVTIAQEIKNIRDYFLLQKERFGERFQYTITVDKSCEQCMIPAMVIQPLVENALIHGVGGYEQKGVISVEIWAEQEEILLAVSDNGTGICPEKIKELEKRMKSDLDYDDTQGIGLYNVYQRMKAFFEQDLTCKITSVPNRRTTFLLTFPCKKAEKGGS
ncbi:MAG: sensor histidine kinase [Lachnospiraceae bacterium]|nr:sensor histidine kinase [Robinsoniella sp.]MDY3765711.1 sensor histidine kinase [Lachnospiraceae bacterium]